MRNVRGLLSKPIISNSGFTLMELVIGIGVTALLMVGVGSMMYESTKRNQQLSNKIDKVSDNRIASTSIINIAELAGLAGQYQHMAIPTSTGSTTGPAVRAQDPNTAQFRNLSSKNQAGISIPPELPNDADNFVQFFRDSFGALRTKHLSDTARLLQSEPYQSSDAMLNGTSCAGTYHQLYATWPLVTPMPCSNGSCQNTGDFFPALSHIKYNLYFRFKELSPDSAQAIHNSNFLFYEASAPLAGSGFSLSSLIDKFVIVHNSSDPGQHVFQLVAAAVDCSPVAAQTNSQCATVYNAYKQVQTGIPADSNLVMLQLKSIDADSHLSQYLPTSVTNGFPSPNTISLFPTKIISLFYSASPASDTPISGYTASTGDFDFIKRFSNAEWVKNGAPPALSVVPVELRALYLRKEAGDAKPRLVVSSYKNGQSVSNTAFGDLEQSLMDEVNGTVIITRKLASKQFGVVTIPAGQNWISGSCTVAAQVNPNLNLNLNNN